MLKKSSPERLGLLIVIIDGKTAEFRIAVIMLLVWGFHHVPIMCNEHLENMLFCSEHLKHFTQLPSFTPIPNPTLQQNLRL